MRSCLHFVRAGTVACLLTIASAAALSCSSSPYGSQPLPDPLRIALLPGENPELLQQRYQPLLDYLAESLGVKCELVTADSYASIVEKFVSGKVDLARFGGVTFAKAHLEAGAIPLLNRDVDLRYTTYFLVAEDYPAVGVDDLAGARFAFGSELSTSGHIMPRVFLEERGVSPQDFFADVRYLENHEAVAYAIRDGLVDAGVASSLTIDGMYADGRLSADDARILWETPPYPDYVWALRNDFNEDAARAIRNTFLNLASSNSDEHRALLGTVNATYFLPASLEDYEDLIDVVERHFSGNREASQ